MKTSQTLGLAALLTVIILALILMAFNTTTPAVQALTPGNIPAQVTPTPAAEDLSVIGSTDGIVVMGAIIALIVTVPLLFRKRH